MPSAWKVAAVKLIPKSSAREDPSSPGNFGPHSMYQQAALGHPEGEVVEAHACKQLPQL